MSSECLHLWESILLSLLGLAYLSYATGTGFYALYQAANTFPREKFTMSWEHAVIYSIFSVILFLLTMAFYSKVLFVGWWELKAMHYRRKGIRRFPCRDNKGVLTLGAGLLVVSVTVVAWAADPIGTWWSTASIPMLAFIPGAALVCWFRDPREVVDD